MMQIKELIPGDRLRLINFGTVDLPYKRRLLSLGMTCGVEFFVIRVAPLGCPVHIELRGCSLIVRQDEMNQLILERV